MVKAAESPTASSTEATEALGVSAVRMRILRLAVDHDTITAKQLMDDIGLSRSGVQFNIRPLVNAGLLIETAAPRVGERGASNRLAWALNRSALDSLFSEFRERILGDESDR